MERDKQDRIKEFLRELIQHTIIDGQLLGYLVQEKIFNADDVDFIENGNETEMNKAAEFFRLIQTRVNSYKVLIQGLKVTGQYDIAKILEEGVIPPTLNNEARTSKILQGCSSENTRPRPLAPKNVSFEVIRLSELFTGRQSELDQLHKLVKRAEGSGRPTVISQLTSITGLGGIGKTQLARQYIELHKEEFDGNCIWLTAETENTLAESFRNLAKDELGITTLDSNGTEMKIQAVVSEVYKRFEYRKSLFIFDNAEKGPWLKQFLPKATPAKDQFLPTVIFTSREREWNVWGRGIEVIDIKELEEKDAFVMVKKGLDLDQDEPTHDEDTFKLIKRLQCFPLALQQAISYIQEQQIMDEYSISNYLDDFEKQREELLSFANCEFDNDYTLTTFTTWKMTVEKIKQNPDCGSCSVQILHTMAYLSPDKIKRDLFSCLPGIADDKRLKSAVRLLVKYSMVNGESRQSILSIHRLVQEVTRIDLTAQNKEVAILHDVLKLIGGADLNLPVENLSHMLVTWEYASKHSGLLKKFSRLGNRTVYRLQDEGKDDQAVQFGTEAVAKLTPVIGETHYDVLGLILTIGQTLLYKGDIDGALTKVEHVMEHLLPNGPAELELHFETLGTLGRICIDKMMYEEALQIFQSAYERMRMTLPASNPLIRNTRTNIASALSRLGRTQEAVNILTDIYKALKQTPQNNLADLLSVQLALGESLNAQENYTQALEVLEETFGDYEQLSGTEQIHAISIVELIGGVLNNMGNFAGALEKNRQVYTKYKEIFGEDHLDTLNSSTYIAENLSGLGKYEEAVALLETALGKLRELQGEDDYDVIRVQIKLASALVRQVTDLSRASKILGELRGRLVMKGWYSGEVKHGIKSIICGDIADLEKAIQLLVIYQGIVLSKLWQQLRAS